jgi:GAF domain-containing protein
MADSSPGDSVDGHQLARLIALDELLPTLAGVLDIREVFERVSAIARRVIPHDLMSLPLLTEDKNSIVIHAVTANAHLFPETVPLPDHHRPLVTSPWEHVIYQDIQTDPLERMTPPGQAGYRARLLVPIRVLGEMLGAIDFLSLQPDLYTPKDVLVARRIADHVALALSHQRLAEQARKNEELRRREAKLESRVQALTDELNTRSGVHRVIGKSVDWQHVLKQATKVLPPIRRC